MGEAGERMVAGLPPGPQRFGSHAKVRSPCWTGTRDVYAPEAGDLRSLEQDLVNLRSSAPEDLPEMSFGVEDLRLLQETSVVVPCLSDLAQVAAELLSLRDTDIAQRIS